MLTDPVEFKHQSVRDLAWAVCSPPLISKLSASCVWPESKWFKQIFEQSLPWLLAVDEDPVQLEKLLAEQKDRRLGKYFETLWYFWLCHNPRYQVIEHNLQIIIDGETLGEIDFIVLDKVTKKIMHWEVAVKFYLGVGDTSEMINWHGPNLCDRLDIKVDHLLHRQSVVSRDQRVAKWLKQRGLQIDCCTVILKGRLYYPWQQNVVSPEKCCADHLRSWWLNTEQFVRAFDDEQRFSPLINTGWMERNPTLCVKKSYNKKALYETVSNEIVRLPLHLALCNPCHTRDRLFLVGLEWP
ncbi:MAG: DUF1853 family protein [Proteobacteria bacterium]|nr:DUF1853 family protein [Pseudomonadota bacterium]